MALTAPPSALEEDRVIELAHSVYLRGRQNSQSQGCHMLNGPQEREPCSAQERKHRIRKQRRKQTHATPTTDPAGQTGAAAEPGKTRTVSSLELIIAARNDARSIASQRPSNQSLLLPASTGGHGCARRGSRPQVRAVKSCLARVLPQSPAPCTPSAAASAAAASCSMLRACVAMQGPSMGRVRG